MDKVSKTLTAILLILVCVILGSVLGASISYLTIVDWQWIEFSNLNDEVVEIHGYSPPYIYVKLKDRTWLRCHFSWRASSNGECEEISSEELNQHNFDEAIGYPHYPIPPKIGEKVISYEAHIYYAEEVSQISAVVLDDGSLWVHSQEISIYDAAVFVVVTIIGAIIGLTIGVMVVIRRRRRITSL